MPGAIRTATIDISKAFDSVWRASLLYKLNPYAILTKPSFKDLAIVFIF